MHKEFFKKNPGLGRKYSAKRFHVSTNSSAENLTFWHFLYFFKHTFVNISVRWTSHNFEIDILLYYMGNITHKKIMITL